VRTSLCIYLHIMVYVYRSLLRLYYITVLTLCIYSTVYMYIGIYYCFTTVWDSFSVDTRRSVCKRFTTVVLLCGSHSPSIHSGVYVYRALLLRYCFTGLSLSTHIEVHTYKELCYCFATVRSSLSVYTPWCICVQCFTTALRQRELHSLSIHSGVYVHRASLLLYYCAGLTLSIYMAIIGICL
jgi:hypothetical protein